MPSDIITFVGRLDSAGDAYPLINNSLVNAWEKLGYIPLRNIHNDGEGVTPLAVAHEYPPRPLNVRHERNICMTAWEFGGAEGFPRAKVAVVNTFDKLLVPSQWLADVLAPQLDIPVQAIRWGVDPAFTPDGERYPLPDSDGKTRVLWLGGTDPRHGFDVALKVLSLLPDTYHLVAKQSAHYPPALAAHPRLTIIREDLSVKQLASLYRACDVLLQSARGVGFSLPVLEAAACGLPVVASDLPPLRDFPFNVTRVSGGVWTRTKHHIYKDCDPYWLEPDAEMLAKGVQNPQPLGTDTRATIAERYSWQTVAKDIWEALWN